MKNKDQIELEEKIKRILLTCFDNDRYIWSKANKDLIALFLEFNQAQTIKVVEKIEKMEELHSHNSIPCYRGDEDEGCCLCIRNKALDDVILALKDVEEK